MMRSLSTSALAQPRLTNPTLGAEDFGITGIKKIQRESKVHIGTIRLINGNRELVKRLSSPTEAATEMNVP
jgi:hypothetical protein